MRTKWLAGLLPAIIGLVVLALTSPEKAGNPTIYLRTDLGTLCFLIGLLTSVAVIACLTLRARAQRKYQEGISGVQAQAAEEKRRFLQRLDHELKNPLTAIRAGLANVRTTSDKATRREDLVSVEAQALRISRLAADLRRLAELETVPLERNRIDLSELLREVVTLVQEQLGANERQLTLTLPQAPWPLPAVMGDWDLVLLAVYNLVNNALKFTRAGDPVEVRAFEDRSYVAIEVADTGPGIPEEEAPRVWEELYRGQEARGVPGAGLGLAMVRAVVERHAGTVALRSRVGQGTVVTLRLPIQ